MSDKCLYVSLEEVEYFSAGQPQGMSLWLSSDQEQAEQPATVRAYLVQRSSVSDQQEAVDNCNVDANHYLPGSFRQIVKDPVNMSVTRPDQWDYKHAEP
ncbi:hypothetical protein CesoFtcFv8_008143 [Champsocephalus esox]|uniref:Uncharacterized protein n=1 Tax=Champsocephalus esox TaxID=159716 RepID=A0AAN8H815_9TELE|nr:hypothetical protein CesoFtcFv8_008143 [Champsocephalus esox]